MIEVSMMELAATLKQLDPEDRFFVSDASAIAEILVPVKDVERFPEVFFRDAARAMARAVVVHLATSGSEEQQCMRVLYDCVFGGDEEWMQLLKAMRVNPVCEGLVMREAKRLELMSVRSPDELSAIFSALQMEMRRLEPLPEGIG